MDDYLTTYQGELFCLYPELTDIEDNLIAIIFDLTSRLLHISKCYVGMGSLIPQRHGRCQNLRPDYGIL